MTGTLGCFFTTAMLFRATAVLAAPCELRVFPTDQVSVVTGFENFGLLGALLGCREQPKDIFLRDLPEDAHTEAVAKITDLTSLLKLSASVIVREASPVSFAEAKKKNERLTTSTADCYAELVIVSIEYTSNIANGRRARPGACRLARHAMSNST